MAKHSQQSWLALQGCALLFFGPLNLAWSENGLTNPPAAPVVPSPQPLAGTTNVYTLGAVMLDKLQRTVSFPAVINQRSGVVEYGVVTTAGKTHESVFRTDAEPLHVHLAMLLLGAKPANTNFRTANLAEPPPGEPVTLEVSWKDGNRVVRRALEDFIVVGQSNRTMSAGPWIYNGSYMARKTFLAQRDGSIISVHIDPDALVNNPRPGRENDELHTVNGTILPKTDLPVEITLRLPNSNVSGPELAPLSHPAPANTGPPTKP